MKDQNIINSFLHGGYEALFLKLILVVIIVFVIIMLINFLNDKFVSKQLTNRNDYLLDMLTILSKLFHFSGFGFIIGNILQAVFTQDFSGGFMSQFGSWSLLAFGIVLIFIGLGFKYAKRVLVHEREELENSQK